MNVCAGLDFCAAKNAIANLCPADKKYDKSRASRSSAICSNTPKIKSLSYKKSPHSQTLKINPVDCERGLNPLSLPVCYKRRAAERAKPND